jgi:hypothetical protein
MGMGLGITHAHVPGCTNNITTPAPAPAPRCGAIGSYHGDRNRLWDRGCDHSDHKARPKSRCSIGMVFVRWGYAFEPGDAKGEEGGGRRAAFASDPTLFSKK